MKISRLARDRYEIPDEFFSSKGDVLFEGNVLQVRKFVQLLNSKRDLLNFPEKAVKTSDLYALGLITEIKSYIFEQYLEQIQSESFNQELFAHLESRFGRETILESTISLVEEFPPSEVYSNQIASKDFLEVIEDGSKNEIRFLDDFVKIWLLNSNSAFVSLVELFDDETLEKQSKYLDIVKSIHEFINQKPQFEPTNENILETLRKPEILNPHSKQKQLDYIREHWTAFIGKWNYHLLTSLDLIREEHKMRGGGPGKPQVLDFEGLDVENYSPDSMWMPKVIMIAKNTYVWLDQLSKKYQTEIRYLNQIPDQELKSLAQYGFTALWLIGLWERSNASKIIKHWCGNSDAVASAYSLFDYQIADDLGGYLAYQNLKDRAIKHGIRLASDMVPNHTGIDSKWMREHPDWYVSLPQPPFPSYQYSGADLCEDPNIGVYVEDKYFSRTDAAVTFKRVDFQTNRTQYIYHGNDGTSMPWNDTAQLDFLKEEVREAVIQKIIDVARMFPIIRFDAAMTLARKHFQRLWYPEPGSGGDIPSRAGLGLTKTDFILLMPKEFWREVVERVQQEVPDTLLLAEAFWLLEGFFVRTLGMHRVYNSIFMNALRDEENSLYRDSIKKALEFDRRMLKRFVNFMNNPDEETAVKQFGSGEKYFGVALLLITMPGLPMFGHGQIEGFAEKYGMEFRKSYWDEKVDSGLLQHHERTIFPIMHKRHIFAESDNFYLYDFWSDGHVNEDVFAYSNFNHEERGFVIYNNRYRNTNGYVSKSVGYNEAGEIKQKYLHEALNLPQEGYSIFKDYMSGMEFIRRNLDITTEGLYFELSPYQGMCFVEWNLVDDNEFFHYAQLCEMLNGKGVTSIQDTLNEMVYKPILTPFRELYNTAFLTQLFSNHEMLSNFEHQISSSMTSLIKEVKRYANNETFEDGIQQDFIKLGTNLLFLFYQHYLKPGVSEPWQTLRNTFPTSLSTWYLYYGWIIVHKLGIIKDPKDYALISRSWFEDWRFEKVIRWELTSLETDPIDLDEELFLLKILILIQEWEDVLFDVTVTDLAGSFRQILAQPDIQTYLRFNRYQSKLWFNQERMQHLIDGIIFTSLLKNVRHDDSSQAIRLKSIYTMFMRAIEKSLFQVDSFLELLQLE